MNIHRYFVIKDFASDVENLFDSLIHKPWCSPTFQPEMERYETRESYVFELDCPGMKLSDLDVKIRNGILIITGERIEQQTIQKASFNFRERSYGKFIREEILPEDADPDQVSVTLKNGVLHILVKKKK